MPLLRPLSVLVAGAALLAPAAASADAPWSAPGTLGSPAGFISEPALAFDQQGRALASARFATGRAAGVVSESRVFAGAPGAGLQPLGRSLNLEAAPQPYATRAVAFLRRSLTARDRGILGTSFGSTTTSAGGLRELTSRAATRGAAFDVNASGEGALVWVEQRAGGSLLRLALRRPGGSFRLAGDLRGSGAISAPVVALGDGGDLVVAWQRELPGRRTVRSVESRVRRRGHGFGGVQVLGPSAGFAQIAAGTARSGRMTVAWGTQDAGEQADGPWVVRAAVRPAGGSGAFRDVKTLDPGEGVERPAGTVAVAVAPDGTATVLWSGIAGRSFPFTYPVYAATQDDRARFASRSQLAPSGAAGDVAAGADGRLLAVWGVLGRTGLNQLSDTVRGALRPAGARAWSAPETISPSERAGLPRAAFDPATGRPSVVWVAEPGAPPVGESVGDDVFGQALRIATRAG